ncbi:MAG: alanine--glyoxylate aminotransferase family protein [Chromatiales bacterium]|jgi:(S)-ureidoglycine---glyoxylate transaminase|nr:alanine--glyoxylate aminotransferase family protein [Chromatiales bacterium]
MDNHSMYEELNPAPRRLLGPGPVEVDPRVLRAMSMPMLGQFDPQFTGYMNEVMGLYRQVFRTDNHWTFLVDGTARAGIEAILTSVIEPGDKVLVPVFGRFGHLLCEISERLQANVIPIHTEWGTVFEVDQIEDAVKQHRPKLVAVVQGDTSTTMAQPLDEIGHICHAYDALVYTDATASITGLDLRTDEWQIDAVSAGLQKCLSGPPGVAPITFNERVAELVRGRKHIEAGIRPDGFEAANGPIIQSNYFDLAMLMDYWSESRLNHHTEATSMLYAARESARLVMQEGLDARFARHTRTSRAITAGFRAMGLEVFGDQRYKMPNVTGVVIPESVTGEAVRMDMLEQFGIEIGTSFGPLHGKIWRIGTMGYGCRKDNVLACLGALEACLRRHGFSAPAGAGVEAAWRSYDDADNSI